jgi:ferredoxin-type protein NapH
MSTESKFSRQNLRKWILIISFVLLPVTLVYISPLIIVMGAAEGVATGSMILFVLLFIFSLAVSRLWCGWLCPMGAWQEICSPVMKYTVRPGWRNSVKYIVTALWLALIAYLLIGAGGIRSINPFYNTDHGLSITSLPVLVIVVVIFIIIFAVAYLAGRRGFCHVLCPVAGLMVAGRKIRNLAGWPALQLDADKNRCIDSNACSKECPMGLDVHGMVQEEKMENADCILCGSCADVCPKGAVCLGWSGKQPGNPEESR